MAGATRRDPRRRSLMRPAPIFISQPKMRLLTPCCHIWPSKTSRETNFELCGGSEALTSHDGLWQLMSGLLSSHCRKYGSLLANEL